jgi:hypothetical protein
MTGLLAGVLVALVCGCETVRDYSLTCRLWDGEVRSYCEPLSNPDLALYDAASKKDVLVQYNSISDRQEGIRRRAYFLEANRARIQAGKAPHFVHRKPRPGWPAIPVSGQPAPVGDSVSTNIHARMSGKSFTLYRQDQLPETCPLPDYRDDHQVLMRAALTPFAVTGDAIMAGTVVGLVAAYCYVASGGPGVYCH